MSIHWHAPSPPATTSIDLRIEAAPLPSPWNAALSRQAKVSVQAWGKQCLPQPGKNAAARVISIPIVRPKVQVRSFNFAEPLAVPMPEQSQADIKEPSGADISVCRNSRGAFGRQECLPHRGEKSGLFAHTRIKPPGDVIKLIDRLQYVLQPSLESLLAEGSLAFPFQPFPYQFEGVAFLYPRQAAILADEMGLGKTMQAITAIRLLLHRGEAKNILLICPKPLVTNWQREFAVWAPEIPVMAIEGDQAKRRWQWQLPDVPVRIANYELLLRDRELLADQHFDLVALDESQRIKNRSSSTNEVVCSIARKRNWALTGTPVENSADDLLGIFEFLAPGFLSPEMKPRSIGRSIGDYVLRRTKDQVLKDLPPKLLHDEPLDLTPEQRESYRMAEEEGVVHLTELGESAKIQHIFELVLRLKQICNFDPVTGASTKLERIEADLEEIARSGRKAIIFSQWVGAIKKMAGQLERFGPLEYHGRIPSSKRDAVIQRFREDDSKHVLLMSYGAGGVGLNLQFVNYVFLFDRWWNPAVEDQAINRAHRIGVDGPVTVTRFLMLDTIEERIDSILQEKRELFDIIFSGAEGRRKLGLTQQELFGLFQLRCPTGPIKVAA
jgi:SNF2 family DNA or RNA helicase